MPADMPSAVMAGLVPAIATRINAATDGRDALGHNGISEHRTHLCSVPSAHRPQHAKAP
jgi:hypothetical protein